ncbi:unnamed protein product [Mesocestoides corti]|uniref:Ig-like domain-containing protein n=1 Tax=Mesocestoides corti TaxID=53468 RepID=A0A3P6GWC4_MESCO|nr:unnamed protein product [Mesocestoides corti]
MDGGQKPVFLGQPVTLRCTVSNRLVHQTSLSVLFLSNGTMQAENCKAYKPAQYEVTCETGGQNSDSATHTYLFHIKSVNWTDRGKWTCLLSGSTSEVNLEVHAPPKMAPIEVERVSVPSSGDAHRPPTGAESDSLVPANSPHAPPFYGLGTRTNPYDLRSGLALYLKCQTECGYPEAVPQWTVNNVTDSQPRKLPSTHRVSTYACDGKPETREMSTSTTFLNVCCEHHQLIGINKLQCSITGSAEPTASRHIYLLCPGGEVPMTLTSGEIVGLGVAAVALFSLFVTGCVLLRGRSKEGAIISNSHSRGELV